MERISRDTLFLDVAHLYSRRGTCPRARVGAVVAKDRRIISTGYNGAPPGLDHCPNTQAHLDLDRCTRAVHAELNAIAVAARNGISTYGAIMYCTHGPCLPCAQAMLSAGIVEVHFLTPYHDDAGEELLQEAGVILHRHRGVHDEG